MTDIDTERPWLRDYKQGKHTPALLCLQSRESVRTYRKVNRKFLIFNVGPKTVF